MVLHKDGGAIALADICKLAIRLRGIDLPPVNIEQLIESYLCRIVSDFDRLAIIRLLRTDQFVSRVRLGSAAIPDNRFDHARCLIERRLDAPETAAGKDRGTRLRSGIGQKRRRDE